MPSTLEQQPSATTTDTALVVDVDGTLVATDLFFEGVLQLAANRPWRLLGLLRTIPSGKAALKRFVANENLVDVESIPLSAAVVEAIDRAKEVGRPIVLASGADHSHVAVLAERVGASDVLASDGTINLTGSQKLAQVVQTYPVFDYIGNESADLPMWRQARRAYAVAPWPSVMREARNDQIDLEVIENRPSPLRSLWRAMRPHQWAKNGLLFLPALAAHQLLNAEHLWMLALGFVAFSATASAVYLVNDLIDLPSDRLHHRKRNRPLAAGHLSIPFALASAGGLLAVAAALCVWTPPHFGLVLSGYFALTAAYSFFLKRRQTVDVVTLANLYTIRVVAGGVLTGVHLSRWFLAFSIFLFLSLALAKRVIEMEIKGLSGRERLAGRGYQAADRPVLVSLGTSAAAASALVYCLYITSADAHRLYANPDVLWAGMPLMLYWQARIWILANRGAMDDDPVVFALRDRISQVAAVLFAIVIVGAST